MGAPHALDLLNELAVIMAVAAVTTVLFQRIHQPVVLGYLLAGLIVGPHLPVPVFANVTLAHQMSELGVILLMFSLGLEFSLRNVARVGPTAGLVALIECSLMIWLGYAVARLFGWRGLESLFCGAIVAISSTTIIVKAFAEQGVRGKQNNRLTEIVFGILIVEDLFAILLLAVLTPVASGASLSAGALFLTVAKLVAFLVGMLVVGILVVPRVVRLIVKLGRTETTLVACVGICFVCALLARRFGYSVALGAFLGGALVAESGESKLVERLMEPVRDMFAAVFFVSVGMVIDPWVVTQNWLLVLVLTAVVIGGKVFGVTLGAFLAGNSVRTSVQAGMSLAQIGEFSFIIAGVGVSLGAIGKHLYPIAVAVSAITTLFTPWLIRGSARVGGWVDRRLPHPLQTFVSLYGSWVQNLRETRQHRTAWARIRKLVGLLLVDTLGIAAVVIATSLGMWRLVALGAQWTRLSEDVVHALVVLAAVALAAPFLLGAVRVARALGAALAAEALPGLDGDPQRVPIPPSDGTRPAEPGGSPRYGQTGGLDLAAAPRRALLVALQLTIVLVAGVPLVAVTQPFLPGFPGPAVLLLVVLSLIVPLWRSATNLHGHVRAGAQVILEALARQTTTPNEATAAAAASEVKKLVPGLGETATVMLPAQAPAVGQTLKAINLRGQTGATVIAIDRGPDDIVYPTADETLRAGDVLVLTGSQDAVNAAKDLLLLVQGPEAAVEAG